MRFFDEETGGKKNSNETVIIVDHDEATTIVHAMEEYCKNNPRKVKAKKLLKEMDNKWEIYSV